jgi:anthranilate phosphoribosyltransferase
MTASLSFPSVLSELRGSAGLSADTARRVFDAIFAGEWTQTQIGGLLVALQMRGETAEVVAAAANAMRSKMVEVQHGLPTVVDTCGTGGDGQGTVNLSTGAALIVAAAGVPVAKHGNRAASSKSGSADVLAALGASLDVPAAAQSGILTTEGIAFLFAPAHHPAMRYAGPPRRELGIRTIFNVLGPLANPAGATHQLVGAFSDEVRTVMATALAGLGLKSAWVVHASDGLDEISPFSPTRVSVVSPGRVEERSVSPSDFGLPLSEPGAIAGGDPKHNASIIVEVLSGKAHPARNAFLLNAAACLSLAKETSLKDAAALAAEAVDSGRALATLESWAAATRRATPQAE